MQPLPSTVDAPEAEIVVDGLSRREVVWEQAPGATPRTTQKMASRISRKEWTRGRPGALGAGRWGAIKAPLGVGEVGLVSSSHARYPTGLLPHDPFSDGF